MFQRCIGKLFFSFLNHVDFWFITWVGRQRAPINLPPSNFKEVSSVIGKAYTKQMMVQDLDPFQCSVCDTLLSSTLRFWGTGHVLQSVTWGWLCSNALCSFHPPSTGEWLFYLLKRWSREVLRWRNQHRAGSHQRLQICPELFILPFPYWNRAVEECIQCSSANSWGNQPWGKPDAFLKQSWVNWDGREHRDWQAAEASKEMQHLQGREQEVEHLGGRSLGKQDD